MLAWEKDFALGIFFFAGTFHHDEFGTKRDERVVIGS